MEPVIYPQGFLRIAKEMEDKVPGGLADGKPDSDFDHEQLAKGIKVEMEHTDDKDLAKEIAKDHLTEDKEYYTKLKTIEKKNSVYRRRFSNS